LLRLASYKEDKKKNFLISTKDFISIVDTVKNETEIFTEKNK